MVQIGSRIDQCAHCLELKVCGEFWNIEPRFRVFWCASCLDQMAAGVRAAAARLPLPADATVRAGADVDGGLT